MLVGIWAATGHFQPLLGAEQKQVASCKVARDNLTGLAAEQGKAIGDLDKVASEREAGAEKAVGEARASADIDYAAANRLQQEYTVGDQCAAAVLIIDKELGL
ncbi:hypothetical protein D3C77_684990 [compost metagenome]